MENKSSRKNRKLEKEVKLGSEGGGEKKKLHSLRFIGREFSTIIIYEI